MMQIKNNSAFFCVCIVFAFIVLACCGIVISERMFMQSNKVVNKELKPENESFGTKGKISLTNTKGENCSFSETQKRSEGSLFTISSLISSDHIIQEKDSPEYRELFFRLPDNERRRVLENEFNKKKISVPNCTFSTVLIPPKPIMPVYTPNSYKQLLVKVSWKAKNLRGLHGSDVEIQTGENRNSRTDYIIVREKSEYESGKQRYIPQSCFDVRPLFKPQIGIPAILHVRVTLMRNISARYTPATRIDLLVDSFVQDLYWQYDNPSVGLIEFQPVFSPSYFSNGSTTVFGETFGFDKHWRIIYPPQTYSAGKVFDYFMSVPTPDDPDYKNLRLISNSMDFSINIQSDATIPSKFVGLDSHCVLNYREYQNLLLFSQKEDPDERYYPFGDWALENHLTRKELEKFEQAVLEKDPYALLLYAQFFLINHQNLYDIQRKYHPKFTVNVQKKSSKNFTHLFQDSFNQEVMGDLSKLPVSCQYNLCKIVYDRRKETHPLWTLHFKCGAYEFCNAATHQALRDFMTQIDEISKK